MNGKSFTRVVSFFLSLLLFLIVFNVRAQQTQLRNNVKGNEKSPAAIKKHGRVANFKSNFGNSEKLAALRKSLPTSVSKPADLAKRPRKKKRELAVRPAMAKRTTKPRHSSPEKRQESRAERKAQLKALHKARPAGSNARIAETNVIFVDQEATGDNDGSDWDNAYNELADALKNAIAGDEIWVTWGIYKPKYLANNVSSTASSDPDNAFVLKPDVKIYGGFVGGEESIEERSLINTDGSGIIVESGGAPLATILSGDFAGDDGSSGNTFSNTGENAYHVVISVGDVGNAELNGVIIAGGNAVGSSALTLNSTYVIDRSYGGGIAIFTSSPILTNVVVKNCQGSSGAAISASTSSFTLTNAMVITNQSYYGGIYLDNSDPVITNATITANSESITGGAGAGIYATGPTTTPRIRNTIIYGNTATTNPNVFIGGLAVPSFSYSLVQGSGGGGTWAAGFGANGGNNLDADPHFLDTSVGNFKLALESPAINTGNKTYFEVGQTPDLSLITTDVLGESRSLAGLVDMGAIESEYEFLVSRFVPTGGRVYVKKGGVGATDGSSWANAAAELGDVLRDAKTNTAITEIWITHGTYKPRYYADGAVGAGDPRDKAFVLVPDVKIYGGFLGSEASIEGRDLQYTDGYGIIVEPEGNESATILSGDFLGDDGRGDGDDIFSNTGENAHHVIVSAGDVGETELNGVIIAGGNANGTLEINVNEKDIVRSKGGGIVLYDSTPRLTNVVFKNNQGDNGSAIYAINSSFELTNAVVVTNRAIHGGIYLDKSSAFITNATIAGNFAEETTGSGAGIYATGEVTFVPKIRNTIVYGNTASENPNVAVDGATVPTFYYCLLEGSGGSGGNWDDTFGADGGNNQDADPRFLSSAIGDFRLTDGSPAVNAGSNVFFDAGQTPDLSAITTDVLGSPRLLISRVDIGAMESQYGFLLSGFVPTGGRVYVAKGGEGSTNGSSWNHAAAELGDVLREAKTNTAITEIWVSHGTYKPRYYVDGTLGAGDPRDKSFVLVPNVKIYGGFYGQETSLEQRNLMGTDNYGLGMQEEGYESATVLSGDLDGNDVTCGCSEAFTNTDDNAYHILVSAGTVAGAVLDGVIIEGGNANGTGSETLNTQMINRNSGGGVALYLSAPVLNNVVVRRNQADNGSAIFADGSSFQLTNALLVLNKVTDAGGVHLLNSSPFITNATIAGNAGGDETASGSGVYVTGESSQPKIRNTIIYGNSVGTSPNLAVADEAIPVISYSIVEGSDAGGSWNTDFGTDGGNNLDVDPKFYNASEGAFGLMPTSKAIGAGNNTLFISGATPDLSGISTDVRGTPRVTKGNIDIGAIETLFGTEYPTLNPTDGRLYVKKGGAGDKDGSSWANAAAEVADALIFSKITPDVAQIWVAGGTYHPLYRPDNLSKGAPEDRFNAFLLTPSVKVYGGFSGNETTLEERDLSKRANASILSADLADDDIEHFLDIDTPDGDPLPAEIQNNAFHLVYAINEDMGDATLDGFTVEGANVVIPLLNSEDPANEELQLSFRINELEIPAAMGSGVTAISANLALNNLTVTNNLGFAGAGILIMNNNLTISNSLVFDNLSLAYSSGILSMNGNTDLVNVTVTENEGIAFGTPIYGAGLTLLSGANQIRNSVIYGNFDSEGPSDAFFIGDGDLSELRYSNSIIGGTGSSCGCGALGTDEGNNLDEDPMFFDVDANDFSLSACSPAVNMGENSYYFSGGSPDLSFITMDIVGYRRINQDVVDAGAFEYQSDQSASVPQLAAGGSGSSYEFVDTDPYTFLSEEGCSLEILSLTPTELSGSVTVRSWRDAVVKTFNGSPYVQRHYDIEPVSTTGKATVILYFTQAEFDNFNLLVDEDEYLPTEEDQGDPDADRIDNLRIYQFHGKSSDNSGTPSTYSGSRTVITPSTVEWNGANERWEVTFSVNGFSGFFAGTEAQSPLPVRLVSFGGKLNDQNNVRLDWKVTEQENISEYVVEYSGNARSFKELGRVKANADVQTAYNFVDASTHAGKIAYYRLKIMEMDGTSAYSRLISVRLPEHDNLVIYPVPAKNLVWVNWKENAASTADLVDINGRLIRTIRRSASTQQIDISKLVTGVYFLKMPDGSGMKLVKE